MSTYQDPGWGGAIRRAPIMLIPFAGFFLLQGRRDRGPDGLTRLRAVFLGYLGVLVFFLAFIWLVVAGEDPKRTPAWLPVGLAGYGAFCLLMTRWARNRRLDTSSPGALAGSYRSSFFVGAAFALAIWFAGFVGAYLIVSPWPYLVGMTISVIVLALIAPTRADIERRQHQIAAAGSSLSLGEALVGHPSPAGRS